MWGYVRTDFMGADKMTYSELLQVFIAGMSFGMCLSVIPFLIGETINLIYKIMKGGI